MFWSARFIADSSLTALIDLKQGRRMSVGVAAQERGVDVGAIQDKHYRQQPTMAAPDNGSVEPAQVVQENSEFWNVTSARWCH